MPRFTSTTTVVPREGDLLVPGSLGAHALAEALTEGTTARIQETAIARTLAEREAELFATATGSNEAARKAALTLAMREDAAAALFTEGLASARTARESAEHRATIAREQCRLHRAVLALMAVQGEDA